jgi:ATPase subunit of ABC transporter with duplicated ATPase domains
MLFRFSEVSKSYGAQEVLRAVSFQVNPGEHIGLVGRNGAGKTTILRLISEVESPDKGSIERIKGLRLGLLAQHVDFSGAETVLDAALQVFAELQELETRMRALEHDMTELTGEKLDQVMHEYSDAQHAYEHAGASVTTRAPNQFSSALDSKRMSSRNGPRASPEVRRIASVWHASFSSSPTSCFSMSLQITSTLRLSNGSKIS